MLNEDNNDIIIKEDNYYKLCKFHLNIFISLKNFHPKNFLELDKKQCKDQNDVE